MEVDCTDGAIKGAPAEGGAEPTTSAASSQWALDVRQFVRRSIMEGRVSDAVDRIKAAGFGEVSVVRLVACPDSTGGLTEPTPCECAWLGLF